LKVGIIEDGRVTRSQVGAPQGAVISPTLANVYLHYAYDLWVQRWRRTKATGDVIVVRFADDTIVGFEHEHEAKAFLHDLHERLRAFELALHPDKTRLIRFDRHAAEQRAKLGEGKPETFDGFTHFCTRSRMWGSFVIGRKTIKKRMRAKLKAIKVELRKSMHDPIANFALRCKKIPDWECCLGNTQGGCGACHDCKDRLMSAINGFERLRQNACTDLLTISSAVASCIGGTEARSLAHFDH
jgi:hypothetical protein